MDYIVFYSEGANYYKLHLPSQTSLYFIFESLSNKHVHTCTLIDRAGEIERDWLGTTITVSKATLAVLAARDQWD